MNSRPRSEPLWRKTAGRDLGAGDQGMMFGFASAETHCHMPLAIYLAREIIHVLEADRETNPETPLLPDAKSQVTLALRDDGTLDHVQTVLVSTCHRNRYSVEQIQDYVKELILHKMLPHLPEREVADAFGQGAVHHQSGRGVEPGWPGRRHRAQRP